MNDCCFCNEINDGSAPELTQRYGPKLKHRIVWGSDNYVVFPTIGQLGIGHMLLVPRQHVNSLAECGESAEVAATALLARAENEFGAHVAFEHGTPSGSSVGGCGIVHAHLHVVRAGAAEWRLPDIPGSASWHEVDWRRWLVDQALGPVRTDYLFIRLPSGRCFACVDPAAPSQYLRQWAAAALGLTTWNWQHAGAEPALPTMVRWMTETNPPPGFFIAGAAA